jgi:putative ABC transport system substrate-binding protein
VKRLASLICVLAMSCAAFAQSGKVYRIGMLETTSASANKANVDAFLRGMRDAGYVEGKNIVIDYRSADGRPEKFPDLAAELVRAKPDIILARTQVAALAAKAASSIPIVMTTSADPVGAGVAANLSRPGGNVTGLTTLVAELGAKRLEILRDLLPQGSRVGVLINAGPTARAQWKQIEQAARSLGLQPVHLEARNADELVRALDGGVQQGVSAFLVGGDAVAMGGMRAIVEFAARHRLPAMYSSPESVELGGLMSYGVHYPTLYYRAASYVDKILKGAKPGDLPIEQPTKLNLVINLKAAKGLGIAIPQKLLLRADEVIQ